MTQVTKSYDPPQSSTGVIFGNVVTEKLYDWGPGGPGSGPGALLRETDTVYQWQKNSSYLTAHIVDLPASSVVIDPVAANNTRSGCPINAVGGTASCIAETDSFYDEPAYLTASGISTQHVAPPAAVRGNLTTLSHWLNTANAFVSGHANWYDTGEPYQNIDPLGHTTTLSYGSAYVGAYVTQTCSPQTGTVTHCISGAYDFNTGLLTSFTDQNGQTSNYGYDLMFRITSAQAPVDVANGSLRATTSLSYSTTSLPWSVTRTRSITGALTDSATSMFDGLGRGYKTQHVTPGGTATVDTTFDLGGHVATVSNPYFTTSDSTYGITTNQYDGLDRATQVTKQDGSISAVDYSLGNCTTSTDEAGNKRRGCSDGLGRLVEVDEPNPSAATTSAQASITINGSEQSNPLPAASGTGSVIISGAEGTSEVCTDPEPPAHPVCHNLPDSGTIGIKVGTYPTLYVNYGSGSTGATLALVLQLGFHNDPSSPVDAAIDPANNTKINFTARTTGVATNYPVTYFNGQDFTFSGLAALSGGRDASSSPDTGTVSITVSGTPYSTTYNGSDTGATIATRLSTAISAGSFANAAASGNVITLTAKSTGQGGDYLFSTASTYDTTHFSGPSFTPSPASSSMANGYGASEIGNQSFITLYQYNALGNLLCVEQHGNVAGTGCSAAPSSDTTSPWRVRRFTYDSLGRLLTTHNPESGTITYSYDLDGNLLQKTSPLANQAGAATQTISYCYDELHRVTGRGYGALSCPMASPVVSYTCDVGANAKGKLTSLIDQAGTATYSYDPLGRITGETRVISGISKSLSYGYNLDGSLKSLTYPSGATVTYAPDSAGRVVSAVDSANGINYATGATYDATGSLTSLVNGNTGTFAGMTSTFTYNKRLQPVNMSAASPSQTVFSIGYDFHVGNGTSGTDNGNVWGITNYKDNARNQSFTYDALNRLTSAQNAGTNCETTIVGGKTEYWGNSYAYDAWGNLTNKTVTKCSAENLSVTALSNNWLSGGYVYDAAGNMTHDATANLNYTFDQENRITGAGGYTYTYDGDGNRVKKSNGTTGTLYWNMTPGIVAESDLAGTLNSEYVFFGGKRVARRDLAAPTGVSYYFSDNLKTASVITDSAGVIKAESDYYPWGGELQFIANDSNHYKFTGKERDFESGLDYFGVRYYSNGLGRWTSPDPKGIALRHLLNPQKLNKYSYVLNSPLTLFDPNGMEEVTMQLNAFISKPNVGGFRGDNRSFSADMHASSRVSVTVKVETDPAKNHGNPLIGKPEIRVGTTHQNAQPFLGMPTSHEATSTGPKMPEVTATQDKSGNVTVNIQESLRNPFTPPGSGSIQANVNMTVNQDATKAEVSGSISGSPSFESNFSVDGGATQNLPLQTEPSSTLGFMWGLQGTSNIDKKTDLPPPPKKKDEQQ
ncbi:MAG: hypothetical protein LAO20_21405 [Acidobacteriia bacterium]|nr:hypothetical protein [Terriglobia bacterium]